MYEVIKEVLHSGRFELSDMLKKIDTIWLQGNITDAEKEELVSLARDNANFEDGISVIEKLQEFDVRLKKIEKKEEQEETDEHTEYVTGKWYYRNDKITFKDKKYICTAPEGVVCTWNPEEYPMYWQLVE